MADEPKAETTAQAGKLFDEQEVNRIVEQRLARERSKNEQALAEAEKAKAELAALNDKVKTLETLSATAAEKDKLIEEVHAGLLAEIPEDLRSLVPSELSKDAQIRYITKNKARLFNATTIAAAVAKPESKPDETPRAAVAGALPGGYKSVAEFARAEPKKFLEWDKANR